MRAMLDLNQRFPVCKSAVTASEHRHGLAETGNTVPMSSLPFMPAIMDYLQETIMPPGSDVDGNVLSLICPRPS